MNSSTNASINPRAILVLITTLLALLACQIDIGGPASPGVRITNDPAKSTEVAQTWAQAFTDAVTTGQVQVIFNEAQITSFFAQRLLTREDPLIGDPQVYLRDGQIQVHGILEQGILKSSALFRVEPEIDADGQLSLQVVEASVGPIPAPQILMETISIVLTEALTGTFGSLATGIKITSIAISHGEMAIVGEIR